MLWLVSWIVFCATLIQKVVETVDWKQNINTKCKCGKQRFSWTVGSFGDLITRLSHGRRKYLRLWFFPMPIASRAGINAGLSSKHSIKWLVWHSLGTSSSTLHRTENSGELLPHLKVPTSDRHQRVYFGLVWRDMPRWPQGKACDMAQIWSQRLSTKSILGRNSPLEKAVSQYVSICFW